MHVEYPTTINKYIAGGVALTPSTLINYVSAVFYAKLKAPASGTFTFYVEVDDTARLYLDNDLLINQGGNGNFTATGTSFQVDVF